MSLWLNSLCLLFCVVLYSSAASVPSIKLNDGNQMPAIALGTWLGIVNDIFKNSQPNKNETEQAVLWALDAGYRHIDTAFVYGVENQVGRALTKKFAEGMKREDVYITSKLWNDAHARDAVVPALRRSLENLNLEYLDMYLIHFPFAYFANGTIDTTDYVETWRGMMEAKELGLTKSIGLSNFNKEQIARVLELTPEKPAVVQIEVNLNLQEPDLLSYCKEQDIAVMGYTPFGSLFSKAASSDMSLTKVDDPALVEIAQKYNKTVPQVTLRYLVELGVIPLPKSVSKSRIEENLQVFDFELTSSERDLLKSYDRNHRTLLSVFWRDHPYFPFEKN